MQLNFIITGDYGEQYRLIGHISRVTPVSTPKITEVYIKNIEGNFMLIENEDIRLNILSRFSQKILAHVKTL